MKPRTLGPPPFSGDALANAVGVFDIRLSRLSGRLVLPAIGIWSCFVKYSQFMSSSILTTHLC